MGKLPLTLACGGYDRTEALRNGAVQVEGIDLTYLAIKSPPEIFARMVKHSEFDVAEMSTSHYLTCRAKGDFPFVALPIFPSRVFRHGFIFINTNSGIKSPKDLEGKRVGVPEYRQTAAVWIRGILKQEYGTAWEKMQWFEGGINEPRRPEEVMDLRPEGPLSIQFLKEGETLSGLLEAGKIDAMIGARNPASLKTSPHVERLFPNYRETEREYYRKTGIFPMMHTLILKESLMREKPWVVHSLYKAFVEAKRWGLEQARFSGTLRYMLPWLLEDLDEMDELFGADPWPYGLEANRKSLQTLVDYLVDQRFLKEPVKLEDMFTPITEGSYDK